MAIAKLLGIETEYGITSGSPDVDPITLSTLLVNAYASGLRHHISWDFEDESPDRDQRGSTRPGSLPPMVETHLANAVLTNGARFYVDHAHPEYSSPECASPLEAVRYDAAGEEVLRRAMAAAWVRYPDAPQIVVYKNNSDAKGNSYGTHENFLLSREVPFTEVVRGIVPHLVTRQLFSGAGKVGAETSVFDTAPDFQISQRSEFFEALVGLETTLKRPLVNTRDEPHADPSRYRRLHLILGDANRSQVATFLKLGSTALLLAMIEDGALNIDGLTLADPVAAVRSISADPDLTGTVELADGRRARALEIQIALFEAVTKYVDADGGAAIGSEAEAAMVVERWGCALEGLSTDPDSLATTVDWIAKRRLLSAYAERHGLRPTDPKLRAMDLQYHDLRPERSLADRLGLETLVSPAEIERSVEEPPRTTRAWFRGTCLKRFPDEVATANWDSLVFDLGTDPLRRIPMMDPLRGTADHTEQLLGEVRSAKELVERLERSD
jgi:proteasome accessory factor A